MDSYFRARGFSLAVSDERGLLLLNIGWVYGICSRVPREVAII